MKNLVFDITRKRWRTTKLDPLSYLVLKDGKALRCEPKDWEGKIPVKFYTIPELISRKEAGLLRVYEKIELPVFLGNIAKSSYYFVDKEGNKIDMFSGISFLPMFMDNLFYPEEK